MFGVEFLRMSISRSVTAGDSNFRLGNTIISGGIFDTVIGGLDSLSRAVLIS